MDATVWDETKWAERFVARLYGPSTDADPLTIAPLYELGLWADGHVCLRLPNHYDDQHGIVLTPRAQIELANRLLAAASRATEGG